MRTESSHSHHSSSPSQAARQTSTHHIGADASITATGTTTTDGTTAQFINQPRSPAVDITDATAQNGEQATVSVNRTRLQVHRHNNARSHIRPCQPRRLRLPREQRQRGHDTTRMPRSRQRRPPQLRRRRTPQQHHVHRRNGRRAHSRTQ